MIFIENDDVKRHLSRMIYTLMSHTHLQAMTPCHGMTLHAV